MRVLVVEPETLPYEKEIIGLEEMQATVGGLIDAIYPWEDRAAIVCNDEALLLDMPFNRSVEGGYVAGWSQDRELEELRQSLSTIRDTAAGLIDQIEAQCPELFSREAQQERSPCELER